jgi:flagellar biogenesis protein FliO
MIVEYLKALLALIVIVPIIFLSLRAFKKYSRSPLSNGTEIKIKNQLSIGIKERILVVEVEGVRLVVGVSSHAFNTLYILDQNDKSIATQQN